MLFPAFAKYMALSHYDTFLAFSGLASMAKEPLQLNMGCTSSAKAMYWLADIGAFSISELSLGGSKQQESAD